MLIPYRLTDHTHPVLHVPEKSRSYFQAEDVCIRFEQIVLLGLLTVPIDFKWTAAHQRYTEGQVLYETRRTVLPHLFVYRILPVYPENWSYCIPMHIKTSQSAKS